MEPSLHKLSRGILCLIIDIFRNFVSYMIEVQTFIYGYISSTGCIALFEFIYY